MYFQQKKNWQDSNSYQEGENIRSISVVLRGIVVLSLTYCYIITFVNNNWYSPQHSLCGFMKIV